MIDADFSLDDKYTKRSGRVFLTGTQALVRLLLMQRWRDEDAGLNTAGLVTGYRGSPLGDVDRALWAAAAHIEPNHVRFRPAVNEELAATAVIGSQQLGMYPGANVDGVFAMWYGKGPGSDRAGDALKHLNSIGTARHGGALVVVGDDHGAVSSSLAHQCEQSMASWLMPVINPATVQDYLDLGLLGFAMSRYSGCSIGFKAISETVGSSASVDIDPARLKIVIPDDIDPPLDGTYPRWPDMQLPQEERLHRHKLPMALAFARANGINRVTLDTPGARIGIAAPGKAYLDLRQALDDLGIDDDCARALGLRIYKIGLAWPLETEGALAFADGLDEIIVVEEKRAFIESQLKEALYHLPADQRPRIVGKTDERGAALLPTTDQLSPAIIARMLAARLPLGETGKQARAHLAFLDEKALAAEQPPAAMRTPYFCSGCPHNTSTRVPEGSRAFAGTGCHLMAGFMNRDTSSFLHMGAEGANWVGQAPFTDTPHVFQNIGDGTFVHSGCLAIRQAAASDVNITYKILYNDAVAMTGGQPFEGGMTVPDMTRMVHHEGVNRIAVVADDLGKYPPGLDFAPGTTFHERHELDKVQRDLRGWPGVSVIVYDQTCAAELRRRRKRGTAPEPTRRVFINHHVCEGCGDCSAKSNCLSVVPRETWLGTKRAIEQSSCNKDFSCLDGFCPAFVTLEGAEVHKRSGSDAAPPDVPAPPAPAALDQPYGILITGIGGTGVVTTGQLIAVAAHLDGKGVSTLDFAGLAQKGGGVACHVRITDDAAESHPARLPVGGADLLLGGDMVLSAAPESLIAVRKDRTRAVVNGNVAATANNVLDANYAIDAGALGAVIESAVGDGRAHFVEATRIAEEVTGDGVTANAFLLGYALQRGWVPVSLEATMRAIELNGVAVENNLRAFGWGRLAAHDQDALAAAIGNPHAEPNDEAETIDSLIAKHAAFLVGYQDAAYAARFQALVATVREAERRLGDDTALTEAVTRSYFRLLAYKDEYEVARLFTESAFANELHARFDGDFTIRHHLAPPVLARRDADTGHLEKREFGPWMWKAMSWLARFRRLRGTRLDLFGYTAERREERALIAEYEATVADLLVGLSTEAHASAVEIAALAQLIRGFGHVKQRNIADFRDQHARLMTAYREVRPRPARTPERATV